jgi:hypothetical protein
VGTSTREVVRSFQEVTPMKYTRYLVIASTVILGLVITVSDVAARQIPPSAGKNVNTATNCFWESYGSIENSSCSAGDYWIVPLVTDYTGLTALNPTIRAYAPNTTDTVGCYAYSNIDGSVYYQSNTVYPSTFGNEVSLTPTGAYGTSTSVQQVVCFLYQTAWIDNILY